ncbi:MAG TPA: peptidoglycan-binding domain-containing protein [Pyrinomonadaceae bacterium]|nr:peptidoglycan-binding domain-containing protein [Pyrinomonadaceae bacterium]
MSWRLANSLVQLRKQINEAFPERDKSSDGSIGDRAHQGRPSDHNPNAAGVVTAIDVDRDFNDGHDGRELVSALIAARDPRIKYVIFERQISVTGDITKWKPYHGKNAHNHHVHISAAADRNLYDDPSPWILDFGAKVKPQDAPGTPVPALLKRGSRGEAVRSLQKALIERGYIPAGKADGSFGPKTEDAVRTFQSANRLQPDGIAGTMTLKALGL